MSKALLKYIARLSPKAQKSANEAMRIAVLDQFNVKHGSDVARQMANAMRDSLDAPRGNIGQIGKNAGLGDTKISNIARKMLEKEKDTELFGKWSAMDQPTTWQSGRAMGAQAQRNRALKEAIEELGNKEIAAMDRGAMPNRKRQDRLIELAERRDRSKDYVMKVNGMAQPYNDAAHKRGLPTPLGDLDDAVIEKKIPGFTKWMEKKKLDKQRS